MSREPLVVQLGEFVSALRFDELPSEVVDKAKAFVNHGMTISMAGHGSARAAAARKAVLQQESLDTRKIGVGRGATVWVDGMRATRVGAAFANGVAIAVDNRADSYRMLTHPAVLMIPAGIGTAEGEGRSGQELLTAIAAGYEVQCRCARDFIPSTPAHGFRASPIYGILGCAATTAKLMRLSASQTVHAIALAASFAGSLIEGQRTGARDADFSESQAARSGIWAATLAAEGFEGALSVLEGEGGFYAGFTGSNTGQLSYAFTGPLKVELSEIVANLGRHWELLNVKFKVYPTPGFNQPVVWIAHDMATEHSLVAEEIEHVRLEMNYLETQYPSPRFPRPVGPDGNGFGRTPYMVAYTLAAGDYPALERYDARERRTAEDLKLAAAVDQLQKRVEVIGVVGRECFAPRLTVTLKDGRRMMKEYNGHELMWDFARGAHELKRFVSVLPIAAPQYDRFVAAVDKLDKADSVDDLITLTLPA